MTNASPGRALPILAALLLLAASATFITLLFTRSSESNRFEDSMRSARFAIDGNQESRARRELMRASKNALSAGQWREILRLALDLLPPVPEESDYRFFEVLSGRAANAMPGADDFPAYWTWALLRSGKPEKAAQNLNLISDSRWLPMKAEIRLKLDYGTDPDSLSRLTHDLIENTDPDFFAKAAMEAESSELSFDAALLYMLRGEPTNALEQARILGAGTHRWADPETIVRRGVNAAIAKIAQDAGSRDEAINWLSKQIQDDIRRRAVSWKDLQLLGDLAWERYELERRPKDMSLAQESWTEAKKLVMDLGEESLSDESWRIWLNLSVLAEHAGRIRESESVLNEALLLFPKKNEVKAAWAEAHYKKEPAISRRLVRQSTDSAPNDPILGIATLTLDPDAVSPRLYESHLWELFESISSNNAASIHSVHTHMIVTYILDYLSSRRSLDSVDVAIDRYIKSYPDDSWVLSWRLAADATRGFSVIDLIPLHDSRPSPYDEYRSWALSELNWRGIHDSALFGYHAAEELRRYAGNYEGSTRSADALMDAPTDEETRQYALLALLAESPVYSGLAQSPMGDRVRTVLRIRDDSRTFLKSLGKRGRTGEKARAMMRSALLSESKRLLENSLDDIYLARAELSDRLPVEDLSELFFVEALLSQSLGDETRALESAAEAIRLNPDNSRARELIGIEVTR